MDKAFSQAKTKQMEDSEELELHRPNKSEAWETSKLFETISEKVKVK